MLNKRLYKKLSFIIIIALIPLCVLAISIASKDGQGFLKVLIAQEDAEDKTSNEIIQKLISDKSLISFEKAESEEDALRQIKDGKADALWILPSDLLQKLYGFVNGESDDGAVIRIIENKQTIPLFLSHEKLNLVLFRYFGTAKFINFVRQELPMLDTLSDSELEQIYQDVNINDTLFEYQNTRMPQSNNYLLTPIRGLLSILIMLCGMAAVLYCMQDEKKGTFARIALRKKLLVYFACILIAVLNVAAIMLISLYLSGLTLPISFEILNTILFIIAAASFCLAIMQIFKSIPLFCSIIPPLIIAMLAICPVFFEFKRLRCISLLFPPSYYINACYKSEYLLYTLIYSAVALAVAYIFSKFRRHS